MEQETKLKNLAEKKENSQIVEAVEVSEEICNELIRLHDEKEVLLTMECDESKTEEQQQTTLQNVKESAQQLEEQKSDIKLVESADEVTNVNLADTKENANAAQEECDNTLITKEEQHASFNIGGRLLEQIQKEDMKPKCNDAELIVKEKQKINSAPATPYTQTVRYAALEANAERDQPQKEAAAVAQLSHIACVAQEQQLRLDYEKQLEQLRAALAQKDNMITLFQRENAILEKEKQAFRKEKEFANKEKESTVIKFAMKEKLLIDAKKEKEAVEKQLAEAKKEIKNVSIRFQTLNEEKSRITYIMDEKCNELRKYQRECEKLKTDLGHLESKLKYHANKLNMEIEAKTVLEKKLEEERNAPNRLEEKANEKLKVEYEANTILLKHEIERRALHIDNLTKEHSKSSELVKQLQEQLNKETAEKQQLANDLLLLQDEHNSVQNAYSEEMLQSAKLRAQLDELKVLKTQNTLNEEKILELNDAIKELQEKLLDNAQDLKHLHAKEVELLSINKEMSESIVGLQNEICLFKSKAQGMAAENEILKKERSIYDTKYETLETQLSDEIKQKSEERQLLAKHLSEKTKLYETTKMKMENILGDFEATKNKHATVVKELQREIQKYKKSLDQQGGASIAHSNAKSYCGNCQQVINGFTVAELSTEQASKQRTHSRNSSLSGHSSSRRPSESSESETMASGSNATAVQNDLQGPSKKHLVERILRLQQASARQTEKIDFLENHTLSLVAELQKKSKVVQYYMLRDQAGALTTTKSDQNKTELAKYGSGVMSAIYNGIKGENKSMTLELSLEINKKLQAVLEDTLLKNITLKENLDVLGMEVDNLTRKLRQLEMRE